tara:strand:- start:5981 stop:6199 length:219 start_codon:yes stop_codon:yes gene_type:complete
MRNKPFKTPSRSSPKNSRRACLCADNTYSKECCDGSLQAQGIGNIGAIYISLLAQENGDLILQETKDKIFTE